MDCHCTWQVFVMHQPWFLNAKCAIETPSGVERLQLRATIEKLEREVYELREMLLQSKQDVELLLESDLKKKLKVSKLCEQLVPSFEKQYEQLSEEKREIKAIYDTKVESVREGVCGEE